MTAAGRLAVLAGLAASALGCATLAGVGPALVVRPVDVRDPAFSAVLERFAERTLTPEAIDPSAMLAGALREIAATESNLVWQDGIFGHRLSLGERHASVSNTVRDLAALGALLDAVTEWIAEASDAAEPRRLELTAAALRGAVRTADRWATVLAGEARARFLDYQRGSLAGVGCRVGSRDGALRVLSVVPGAPAERAGLRPGDRFVAVDGESVEDHTVADLTGRLRGPEGTRVLLRMARKGHREPLEVAITRERFTSPTVSSRMLDPALGYLRIEHIAKNSGVLARRLVGGLLDGSDTRGLVLDLRGNSGGSILAASAIADLFLREGVLIETKGRGGLPVPELRNRVDATDGAGQEHTSTPLVILVDRKTASSAELLAAVLARHDRALILGQRTFGKAVVQKTYEFGAGGTLTLKVTVARSYAAGAPIPEDGLVPDISLDEESSADLQLHCEAGRSADAGPFAVLGTGSASAGDAALDLAVRVLGDYGRAGRREMLDGMCAEPRWLAREAPTRPHG